MKMSDLRPANEFAKSFGVKCLAYGAAGSGKTPAINTLPRPVLLAVEPGLMSMAGSNVPTWQAFESEPKLVEFFNWATTSAEVKNFDTIAIDSASQMAEIILKGCITRNKHGMQAYGEMSTLVMEQLTKLYYMREKHVYLICKEDVNNEGGDSIRKRPYFPGKDLNIKIPHMFDGIFHFETDAQIKGVVGKQRAIRCQPSFNVLARDRSGKLAKFEPQDLTALFNKAMM